MDEYLFIALAKLKADRLKLEREQREAARAPHPHDDEPEYTPRAPVRWFHRSPEWSKQS